MSRESGVVYEHCPPAAFRGNRDYVHSTDLYDSVVAGAAAAGLSFEGPIDLRIRGKIANRPLYRYAPVAALAGSAAARCLFRSRGEEWGADAVETGDPVTARRDYDEGPVRHAARLEGRCAALSRATGMRPIEAVTALAVHLHKAVLPPPPGKRWMLTQLSLDRPLTEADAATMAIEIVQTVSRAVARSRLDGCDGPFGRLMFMVA